MQAQGMLGDLLQVAEYLHVHISAYNKEMIIYPVAVQIITKREFAFVHLKDLGSCCFGNDLRRGEILIGLVGDYRCLGPAHGNIAYMSGGAPEISDFSGKR